jgi:hypothetical protein
MSRVSVNRTSGSKYTELRIFASMGPPMDSDCRVPPSHGERDIPHRRASNIAFRREHLAAPRILLGGYIFDVEETRLRLDLSLSVATGRGLVVIEANPGPRWFTHGRGTMVLTKLAQLRTIPFFRPYRVPIPLAVMLLAPVGAHMPSRIRYDSFVHRRILDPRPKEETDRRGVGT